MLVELFLVPALRDTATERKPATHAGAAAEGPVSVGAGGAAGVWVAGRRTVLVIGRGAAEDFCERLSYF